MVFCRAGGLLSAGKADLPVDHPSLPINHSIPTRGLSWTLLTNLPRTPSASARLPKHPVPLPTWVGAGIPYGISQVTLTPNRCWNAALQGSPERISDLP